MYERGKLLKNNGIPLRGALVLSPKSRSVLLSFLATSLLHYTLKKNWNHFQTNINGRFGGISQTQTSKKTLLSFARVARKIL